MRICVFGAGAIGGLMAARLAASGADVALLARGLSLAAIRTRGLTLRAGGEHMTVRLPVSDDPAELGAFSHVVIATKAHAVPAAVPALSRLLGRGTAVVTAVNGVPWWYFHGIDGPWRNHRLQTVDPGGLIWDGIGPERAIGCVVYPAAELVEPGLIEWVEGDRFTLGEPDGSRSERVAAFSAALIAAGFKAPIRPRIRDDIWVKLWGNVSFNPISVLTQATLAEMVADDGVRAVARAMMVEAEEVAAALGVTMPIGVDRRIEGAGAVGAHRTSMLQDLDRRRPLELDALVEAVRELGRLAGVATPAIDAVAALARLRARTAGCLQPPPLGVA